MSNHPVQLPEYPHAEPHIGDPMSPPSEVTPEMFDCFHPRFPEGVTGDLCVTRAQNNNFGFFGYLHCKTDSNWEFMGYTLEPGRTSQYRAIPIGKYPFRHRISPHLGKCLLLSEVPDRSLIELHVGNWQSNTRGCILAALGMNNYSHPTMITNSRSLTDDLYSRCIQGRITVRSF